MSDKDLTKTKEYKDLKIILDRLQQEKEDLISLQKMIETYQHILDTEVNDLTLLKSSRQTIQILKDQEKRLILSIMRHRKRFPNVPGI